MSAVQLRPDKTRRVVPLHWRGAEPTPQMATLVQYEELEGSPTYSIKMGKGVEAKRELRVAGSDLNLLVAQFTPFPGNIFAQFPGIPGLWVDTIDIVPFDNCPPKDGGDIALYDWHKVSVSYKTPEFEGGDNTDGGDGGQGPDGQGDGKQGQPNRGGHPHSDNDTLLSHKCTIGGEFMVLPGEGLEWKDSFDAVSWSYNPPVFDEEGPNPAHARASRSVKDGVSAGIIVPLMEYTVTWHRVRLPPWRAIQETIGKINDDEFLGCEAGCLLYLGADLSIEFSAIGTKWWTVEHKFSYKNNTKGGDAFLDTVLFGGTVPKGWNYFYRPETGRFEHLKRKGRTTPVEAVRTESEHPTKYTTELVVTPGGDLYDMTSFIPLFKQSIL